jgi:hypothetical protein
MNVNLGGILGLVIGIGVGLLISFPIDQNDPESFGRAGKIIGIGLAAGAFAGNLAWAYFFDKNKRK